MKGTSRRREAEEEEKMKRRMTKKGEPEQCRMCGLVQRGGMLCKIRMMFFKN